jgi:hypothetical protein
LRFPVAVAIGLLVACQSDGEPYDSLRGIIATRTIQVPAPTDTVVRILLRADTTDPLGPSNCGEAGVFTVSSATVILDPSGRRTDKDHLLVGAVATARWRGPVATSCPFQAGAEVVILE